MSDLPEFITLRSIAVEPSTMSGAILCAAFFPASCAALPPVLLASLASLFSYLDISDNIWAQLEPPPDPLPMSPAPIEPPPPPDEPPVTESAPLPWDEPTAPVTAPVPPVPEERPVEPAATVSPAAPAPEYTADPALSRPRKVAAEGVNPFEQWSEVVKLLQEKDPMLHSYLRKSKAYFDGTRVLIDGGKTFRDFIRVNKDSQRLIKKLIAQVSGVAVPIGPYEPRTAARHTSNAEQSLHALEKLGLDVSIEDSAKKKR